MFTGIITHKGTVSDIEKKGDWKITITVPAPFLNKVTLGASIACSGVCLTVIAFTAKTFVVQVSGETLRCTTLGGWKKYTSINLERALKVGDELGGHIVSGHVDGLATLLARTAVGESHVLKLAAPKELSRYIAAKGSVTLDGVSLTVNKVHGNDFYVNIIPHTFEQTTLGKRKPGDTLNLEIDILARYVERMRMK